MKTYKAIMREIGETYRNKEQAEKLAKAEKDHKKAVDLYAAAEIYSLTAQVLHDNAVCAFVEENAATVAAILEKFDGKPYGPKTAEKMRNTAKAAGLGFYLTRRYSFAELHFYPLDENGYYIHGYEIEISSFNGDKILTAENKVKAIPVEEITSRYTGKYCEKPLARVKAIKKAVQEYRDKIKELEDSAKALNNLLPSNHEHAQYFYNHFYL